MPRRRERQVTNPALRDMVRRAGVPYARLAATINRVGAENGQRLYYDASSISHWMSGTVPRLDVIPVLAEVFTRLLGRPVEPGELGLPVVAGEDGKPDGPWAGDPVIWLERLGRDDMLNRRTMLTGGLYSLAALTLPEPLTLTVRHGEPRRAGLGDAARIREMTSHFARTDYLFGGGHARVAMAAYLVHEVVPLLHGSTGRARPALFGAASQMAYLAGFMAHDDGKPGLAQRYYVQAVRLADEAADHVAKATALRGMSLQAVELGHPARGVDLAEAATAALPTGSPPRVRAWMVGMRAQAHAAAGNGSDALAALRDAEAIVERADGVQPGSGRERSTGHSWHTRQAPCSRTSTICPPHNSTWPRRSTSGRAVSAALVP